MEHVEETLEDMEPMGGAQFSPNATRLAAAEGLRPGDDSKSPAAQEEAREAG